MTEFNRSASVIVGTPGTDGIELKGFRIVFDIKKNDDKHPNKADIKIYNLSEFTRNRIKDTGKRVFLNAGYTEGTGEELIFSGDVTIISHDISKPEVITTIKALDGSNALQDTKISFTFGPGVSVGNILKKIIRKFPFAIDSRTFSQIDNVLVDVKLSQGFSFSGLAKTAMDKTAALLGINWYVINGTIKILKFDGNDGSRAVFLSEKTGLIGSPERFNKSVRKSSGKSKKKIPGWKFRSLLKPNIAPGGQISVKSRELPENSFFTITSVKHSGDTHSPSPWNSVTEVFENA